MSIPMWEYIVMMSANTRATTNRLRMSAAIAAIDMPSPP